MKRSFLFSLLALLLSITSLSSQAAVKVPATIAAKTTTAAQATTTGEDVGATCLSVVTSPDGQLYMLAQAADGQYYRSTNPIDQATADQIVGQKGTIRNTGGTTPDNPPAFLFVFLLILLMVDCICLGWELHDLWP